MCAKRRLPTRLDAKIALASTHRSGLSRREEKRYYWCADCRGYHLTSKRGRRS